MYKGDIEMTIEICENVEKYYYQEAMRLCKAKGECPYGDYKVQVGKKYVCQVDGIVYEN